MHRSDLIWEMNEEADGDCKNRILAEEGCCGSGEFFMAAKAPGSWPEWW